MRHTRQMKRWLALLLITSMWLGGCDGSTSVDDAAPVESSTTSTSGETTTSAVELSRSPSTTTQAVVSQGQLQPGDLGFEVTTAPDTFDLGPDHSADSLDPAVLHAVDTATGDGRWQVELPAPHFPFLQQAGDALIYSYSGRAEESLIGAIDTDGTIRWQATMSWRMHGPFFEDGTTLVGMAGPRGKSEFKSAIVAISLATGEMKWAVPVKWFGEAVVSGTSDAVFAAGGQRTIAIDLTTGDTLWNKKLGQILDGPFYAGGSVHVGTDKGLFALDPADGSQRWLAETGGRLIASPEGVSSGRLVSWLESDAELGFDLAGIDLDTGEIRWIADSYLQFDVGSEFVVAFGPDPNADYPNRLKIWDGATGQLRASVQTPPGINPFSVAISEETVVVGTQSFDDTPGKLISIEVGSGLIRWITDIQGSIGELTRVRDLVIAATIETGDAGAVLAVDHSSGQVRWRFDTDHAVLTRPVAIRGMTFFVASKEVLGRF